MSVIQADSARTARRNILVLGVGPLPVDKTDHLHAPGMRTWQIAQLLISRKHMVSVGLIRFGDFQGEGSGAISVPHLEEAGPNLRIYHLRYHAAHTPQALATLHSRLDFACVISTTDIMNSIAADIPAALPLWLDYNGDPFAEKQLQGALYGNDATLLDQWRLYLKGLMSGDRFSVSSTPQKHALIGHLGFSGRLNQFTAGEDLVVPMPNCSRAIRDSGLPRNFSVKGTYIPTTGRMVLWSGGYNTWCDPETLFRGMEIAMREDPNLYFISTGGEIAGHDTKSYQRFVDLVEASDLVKRFRFLGWRETEEVPAFYRQADAAIVADRFSYEGELGARTRINDWLDFGVPVVASEQCELTRDLASRGLAFLFRVGDAEGLARAVIEACSGTEAVLQRAKAARAYYNEELSEERVFAPMLDWASNPVFASDRRPDSTGGPGGIRVTVDNALARAHAEMLASPDKVLPSASPRRPLWKRVLGRVKHRRS